MEMVEHAEYARINLESWCGGCRMFKQADEFGKNASRKNGLQNKCNVCFAAYRAKNRDRLNAAQRLRYAARKRKRS